MVVPLTDTVPHPGTVMVKLGDASITNRAMLGPDWSAHKTGAAEDHWIKPVTFRQLNESSVLDLLAGANDP